MVKLREDDGRLAKQLRPFEAHGADFARVVGANNAQGICPFCGKTDKLFVNIENGCWDCKGKECVGHRHGNVFTFLRQVAEYHHEDTSEKDFARLADLRSIAIQELKDAEVGWNGEDWLIPVRNTKGTVVDIRRWREKGKLMSTPGCAMGLFGIEQLVKHKGEGWVWICEGEWDAMALRTALRIAGRKGDVVVGVPGAGTFKNEWIPYFKGKRVRICYDADEAGDTGTEKVAKALAKSLRALEYLCWPEELPAGFDTRDFFKDKTKKLADYEKLFADKPRRTPNDEIAVVDAEDVVQDEPGDITTWEEVRAVFRGHFAMTTELEGALKICLATTITTWVEGDPVWVFIVSPPGGLKTEILMSFQDSGWCICKSSLSPRALCSGWRGEGGEDPSLLPKLDGRTFILKDYTEITAMHVTAQEEILGVLRGAFDGEVEKSFGNGIERKYTTHFHILAGVTPVIHGNQKAGLGERFLKYTCQKGVGFNADEAIRAALRNVGREKTTRTETRGAVKSFVAAARKRWEVSNGKLPELSDDSVDRLVALAQLIGMLRAEVERNNRTDQILYRPQHEVGTRLAKQLKKVGIGLAMVSGTEDILAEDEALVRKIAFDTARGFHIELFEAVAKAGDAGILTPDLCEAVRLPSSTAHSRLEDMELLGVLLKVKDTSVEAQNRMGARPFRWHVSKRAKQLWLATLREEERPQPKMKLKVKKGQA